MEKLLQAYLLMACVGSLYSQESDMVIRIKLEQSQYTFTEGQGPWCVQVRTVNGPAPESFPFEYRILSPSHGGDETRDATFTFIGGRDVQPLCIGVYDNEDVCEPMAMGNVQLQNNTFIQAVEVSRADIYIIDEDPVTVTFESSEYTFAENGGIGWVPLQLGSDIPSNMKLQIKAEQQEGNEFQERSIAESLEAFTKTIILESPSMAGAGIQLEVQDDQVALEDTERVTLTLSVLENPCSAVDITPYQQTTILITDDDEVNIDMVEDLMVRENETAVEVCAHLSHRVARPLTLWFTAQDETATGGEDYSSGIFTVQYEAFSPNLKLCTQMSVEHDRLVENSETFVVLLDVKCSTEDEQNEFERKLNILRSSTRVTITDTSQCTSALLNSDNSKEPLYVPPESTVCFKCDLVENVTRVSWILDGVSVEPAQGDVLNDGTLMVTDSSEVFDSIRSTNITCSSKNTLSVRTFLGVVPEVVKLTSSTSTVHGSIHLTVECTFQGAPTPTITWLFGNNNAEHKAEIKTTNSSSMLIIKDAQDEDFGYYSCIAENAFGRSTRTTETYKDPVKEPRRSVAREEKVNIVTLLFAFCISFTSSLFTSFL